MKSKLIKGSSFILLATFLVGCNQTSSESKKEENKDSSNESVEKFTPSYEDYSASNAPKDYENISVNDFFNNEKNDIKDSYFLMNHKMANSTYYAYNYGTADAGNLYSQDVGVYFVNQNGTTFANVVTKGNNTGLGGLLKDSVSNGKQYLENIQQNKFLQKQKTDNASLEIKEENGRKIGSCSEFSNFTSISSRTSFKEIVGHDLFNISNYEVLNPSYITEAKLTSLTSSKAVIEYKFSVSGEYDASSYYEKEQQTMLGSFASFIKIDVTELSLKITFNSDWSIIKSEANEKYDINLSNQKISVTSNFVTDYVFYEGDNILDPVIKQSFNNALKEAKIDV